MLSIIKLSFYDYVNGGCENAFNRLTDRPIVADKCRSWIGHLDMLFAIWPDAKVLVPVRDMRGILSSFEKKWQKHPFPFTAVEKQNPQSWTTVEKRAQGWLNMPPLGIAVERLSDAVKRYKNKLHFVHFESLTEKPSETMNEVWKYLNLDIPKHDFNRVDQYTKEHELGWPYGDYIIRDKVEPLEKDWNKVLGKEFSEQIHQSFGWIDEL
jgi:sulfotransferase